MATSPTLRKNLTMDLNAPIVEESTFVEKNESYLVASNLARVIVEKACHQFFINLIKPIARNHGLRLTQNLSLQTILDGLPFNNNHALKEHMLATITPQSQMKAEWL
jgi:hypothetical protein